MSGATLLVAASGGKRNGGFRLSAGRKQTLAREKLGRRLTSLAELEDGYTGTRKRTLTREVFTSSVP